MQADVRSDARPVRGRVVMLVDNGVHGDSRVQKAARSAAEAGWEVILVGILWSGTTAQERWWLGDVQVRLIKVPGQVPHPITYRRALLRRPFAYRPGPQAKRKLGKLKARRDDLNFRLSQLKVARMAGGPHWRLQARKAGLAMPYLLNRAMFLWARFRARELRRLQERRRDPNSWPDRTAMRIWQILYRDRAWRRLDPQLWDFELAFAPEIDKLRPDIIHAHDFRMLGVGARATMRARAGGRDVKLLWDAHEFVPGILGRPTNPRWLPAQVAWVREHAPFADAVITVSDTLADLLREMHDLPEQPAVVLNAPPVTLTPQQRAEPVPDIRALCGIDTASPLLVYCGGINRARGVDTMIRGLTRLPDAHAALVSLHPNGQTPMVDQLEELAAELGVADRLHLLPYVPHWQVSAFVAPADIGVIPTHRKQNYELALPTKFFEYAHARLPMVVSDLKTVAEATRATGQGEVFRAEDVDDYVRAVRRVLADPKPYRTAYDRPGLLDSWSWEAQARVLDEVYARLRPDRPRVPASPEISSTART